MSEKDRCAMTEKMSEEMVDMVVSAFDGHLEGMASTSKRNFRWIKMRCKEKTDVHRVASKAELKVYS